MTAIGYEQDGREHVYTARTASEIEAMFEADGCVRVEMQGGVLRKVSGEWTWIA